MCINFNLLYTNCKTIRSKPHKISKISYCKNGDIEKKIVCKDFFDAGGISSRIRGDCPFCEK